MEDWSSVNTISPTGFHKVNNVLLNKELGREFWVKTNYNSLELDWFADTGSPRLFMQYSKAQDIVHKYTQTFKEKTRYKCFNNQDIKIRGVLNITLRSGSWTAKTATFYW